MKKLILTSSAIAALTLSGAVLADVNMGKMGNDAVKTAIEANDFAAFQIATKDSPMAEVDTQAEFDKMVAMHAKMKTLQEEMKTLHTSLGIVMPEMKKDEKHDMKDMKKPEHNDAVKKAIEANDFAAFQIATKDSPMAVVDTQAEFDKMVAMHAKMQAAHEEMKALHTELGLPEMKMDKKHKMKDMKEMKKTDWKAGKMNLKEKKKMSEAITTGTYEQFVASVPAKNPLLSFVTKENFSVLQELVAARKAGDSAKVKALALQLGIDKKEIKHVRKMIKK